LIPPDFQIEDVDIDLGLSLSGGDIDDYIRTLKVFCEDGLAKTRELRDCLENNDIGLYATLVHGLKSAAISVGAKKASNSAASLENAGKDGCAGYIADNTESFLAELSVLLANINVAVAAYKSGIDGARVDADDLNEKLEALKIALDSMDAQSINNIVKDLEDMSWDDETENIISRLSRSILLFDYDEAFQSINDLQGAL